MSSVTCERLWRVLIKHQNDLQKVRPQIYRLSKRKEALNTSIREVVEAVRRTEQQQQVGGIADKLGLPGKILGPMVIADAEIRKARLKDEVDRLREQLRAINGKIDNLETDKSGYEHGIDLTTREIEAFGCDSR